MENCVIEIFVGSFFRGNHELLAVEHQHVQ
jgi:hypothetical protein